MGTRLGCTITTLRHIIPTMLGTRQRACAVGADYIMALLHRLLRWASDGIPLEHDRTLQQPYSDALVRGMLWATSAPDGNEQRAREALGGKLHAKLRGGVDNYTKRPVLRPGKLVLQCLIGSMATYGVLSWEAVAAYEKKLGEHSV